MQSTETTVTMTLDEASKLLESLVALEHKTKILNSEQYKQLASLSLSVSAPTYITEYFARKQLSNN